MSKWCDTIRLDKPTTITEHIVNRKTVNKNLRTYSYLLQDFKWYEMKKKLLSRKKNVVIHLIQFMLTDYKTPEFYSRSFEW